MLEDVVEISCPWCGEAQTVFVDPSVTRQTYIEDCQICCQPMQLTAIKDDDRLARCLVERE